MNHELYHVSPRRGYQKKNHKYVYREWKNGHWVYHYEDGTQTTDYPKGQNYKTAEQRKQEENAAKAAAADKSAREKEKAKQADIFYSRMGELIDKGVQAVENIGRLLNTKVVDLPDSIEWLSRDK